MVTISTPVKTALDNGGPVVALESTIISHGMPFPRNVETALRVEQAIREGGAVPATCAVINGKLKAGLSSDEIEHIGRLGHAVAKASRRDLPYLISQQQNGATTVAATMMIAHKAGIRIFATGGIGGVHRGATTTMDISADLQELALTPVAVISAGVKSILDIGLTLEYLETCGVPVIGYKTNEFPAFYSRESGFQVDYKLDDTLEIARLLHAKWSFDKRGGAIIANPVPLEFSQDSGKIENIIRSALEEANKHAIKGKAITPFLLSRIEQLTGGESLDTNIELVCNNAALAARIAVDFTIIERETQDR